MNQCKQNKNSLFWKIKVLRIQTSLIQILDPTFHFDATPDHVPDHTV
jgi:hypothetical protein